MAFGTKFIANAEREKQEAMKKVVAEQEASEGTSASAPEVTPQPQPPQPTPSAPATPARRQWQRQPASSASAPTPQSTAPVSSQPPAQSRGFQAPVQELSADERLQRLVARAKRYVQDLGEYQGWTPQQIALKERECQSNPQSVIDELTPIAEAISNRRKQGERSLDDAIKKNPNQVVFMLVKGDNQKLRSIDPIEAGGQKLLHGSVVESLPASKTLFAPPRDVFVKNEPADQAPPAPSSPKP